MKYKIILSTLLLINIPTYAGLNGLTHHSRANCLTLNESVSWELGHRWKIKVDSIHFPPGKKSSHTYTIPEDKYLWINSWRIAPFHIGEAISDWIVVGYHEIWAKGYTWKLEETSAIDCSIYDGWWNKDHPERSSKNKGK